MLIFLVIPFFVNIPLNLKKPLPHIIAILLIIFSILGTIKNFKTKKVIQILNKIS